MTLAKMKKTAQESIVACRYSLEKLNLGPRKKLLVLGLGGLLCHRVYRRDRSRTTFGKPDASYGNFFVYKRPYCEEFMKFCLEKSFTDVLILSNLYWQVDGIWKSALNCIMKGLRSKLLFAWDQEQCTDSGFKALENKRKPIFLKELKKLHNRRIQYSASNTLLIDDNPYKALLNPII
ncbi:hypothetical protein FH972_016523 [Carpinus fangiana]|uniref:Mitochondrial import inner membrane translocase subunit TIM50 n=1 Tax=Carpinus fangiana TaxID=176857 RepID=A0A5N6RG52_9ROSI|nr:hypothetical protein FH972_016523 [Carpinus fangiana]